MLLLLSLMGCDLSAVGEQVDDFQDTLDGLTNPLIVQGLILGVAEPDSEQIDLSGTDFANGTAVTIFAADAANANDMENAPVAGADISVKIGEQAAVTLDESAAGAYNAAGDGLAYTGSAMAELSIGIGDSAAGAQVVLPPPADANIPEFHDGTELVVDLSSQSFDQVLVVVLNGATGEVTYSNEPKDVKELYEFSTAENAGASLTIPASAFPDQSIYAVGIAGLAKGDSANFSSMNTALSSLQAGQLVFYPVSTMGGMSN